MLYYPFHNGLFSFEDITQSDAITQTCKLCYILIKHIVSDNRINELYASQWIELFFDHAMRTTAKNNMAAEVAIKALVTNNKRLLNKQISAETIYKFISLCRTQEKNKRFIELLTALCSCMGEAVESN